MKSFLLVSAVLAVARAGVFTLEAVRSPVVVAAVPVAQHSSQYHSQDAIGQYAYGYADELSAKNEIRSADGQTVGAYSYVDPEGKLQNVQYRSDALNGFRVSATNLPEAPSPIEAPALPIPEPVKDTPEVVEARTRHLEALRQAEEAAKKSFEAASMEAKSAIHAHPAIISAATPSAAAFGTTELLRAAPIIAAPSFGYSFGINYGGLYTVNSYSLSPQSIVAAYVAPANLIAAPIVAGAVPVASASPDSAASSESAANADSAAIGDSAKDTEVVEARAAQSGTGESPGVPQQDQAKE